MVWVARLLIVLFGVLFISIGFTTLLNPENIMSDFGLSAVDETGRNTVRADIGAFFICSAVAAFVSLIPGQKHWLLGSIALLGVAFLGRLFGLFLGGTTPAIVQFMLTEAVAVGILVFGYVMLSKNKTQKAEAEIPGDTEHPETTSAS